VEKAGRYVSAKSDYGILSEAVVRQKKAAGVSASGHFFQFLFC